MRILALALALLTACASVEVSPRAPRASNASSEEQTELLARWAEAVELANAFLASPFRRTLPRGELVLADDGMLFETELGTWPIEVRCTSFGDLVRRFEFQAQERSFGFVVGECPPERDRRVDNAFFRELDGDPLTREQMADLVLHETTHVVWREGTVSFWKGVGYYLEAIFLFRYANHSAERKAHGTSQEFRFFRVHADVDQEYQHIYLEEFEEHLASDETRACAHGPFDRQPPAVPVVAGGVAR